MLKGAIYRRLHEILTAKTPVKGFEYLEQEEKRRILEILHDTKGDLPAGWL
jgi:DNA-directed RNA polymerase subunit H (RpoH/RPB5)